MDYSQFRKSKIYKSSYSNTKSTGRQSSSVLYFCKINTLCSKNRTGITGSDTSVPHIYIYPKTITGAGIISCSYIRKPNDIVWGYKGLPTTPNAGVPWTTGPYIYDSTTSVQFELDPTEKTNIIIRILGYSGVIIRDPEIVQAASQKAQSEEVNSKS